MRSLSHVFLMAGTAVVAVTRFWVSRARYLPTGSECSPL